MMNYVLSCDWINVILIIFLQDFCWNSEVLSEFLRKSEKNVPCQLHALNSCQSHEVSSAENIILLRAESIIIETFPQ